jgi:hypothetical protein
MKSDIFRATQLMPQETVAQFGRVQIIRTPTGRYKLMGGSKSEQTSTQAWCECFAPLNSFTGGLDEEAASNMDADTTIRIQQIQRERQGFDVPLWKACEALWLLTCPRGQRVF